MDSRGGGHLHDVGERRGGLEGEPFDGGVGLHEFAVVFVNHGGAVAQLARHAARIGGLREMVRGVTAPRPILILRGQLSSFPVFRATWTAQFHLRAVAILLQ